METILCPTDFSPISENAIRYANGLAQRMKARIVLFHNLYEPAGKQQIAFTGVQYPGPIPDPDYQQAQQSKLDALKSNLEITNLDVTVAYQTHMQYGLAQDTIPQVARQLKADLVVMGKEGNGALKDIFLGSITGEVLDQVTCPVLVIPPKAAFRHIQRIVFATDLQGEPFTDMAFVSKLASLFGAHILFLHILTGDAPDTRQRAQAGLDRLHKRLSYKNVAFFTEASAHIEEGISQFCRHHQADLLVMGYHPHPFWQQLFDQHHAQQMAYHADLPLLVIHYRG
jgi:nucleotide-binding universal stress UspA family protein